MTTIVTGSGRSGTHWLAHTLEPFVSTVHEPANYEDVGDAEIIVDCRLHGLREQLERKGYRLIHLVRDGREVVRSRVSFYQGRHSFEHECRRWAEIVDACDGLETVRLESLLMRQAQTREHHCPHWSAWTAEQTATFWRICGDAMRRHGYVTRESDSAKEI